MWTWALVARGIAFLLQLFSAVASVDTVFVTLFPTTVETVDCKKVHKLLRAYEFPTTLITTVAVVVVGRVFCAWSEQLSLGSNPSLPLPSLINSSRFLWTSTPMKESCVALQKSCEVSQGEGM